MKKKRKGEMVAENGEMLGGKANGSFDDVDARRQLFFTPAPTHSHL